jgi:hypothetical protein
MVAWGESGVNVRILGLKRCYIYLFPNFNYLVIYLFFLCFLFRKYSLWIFIDNTTGGDITGGFFPGAGFPSCHKSIYRVSEDNFRGSACVSEWMLISVKDGGLVFHNLRLHKYNKLE